MQSGIQDSHAAKAYFEHKVAFTTSPFGLAQMLKKPGSVNVVDVRAAEDFAKGHVPGAINMPQGSWDNTSHLNREKINVVYCYSPQCYLAAQACAAFAAKWFPVMELEGGFDAWKEQDFEIEQEQPMKAAA